MENITDWLLSKHFTIDHEQHAFIKGSVYIPFSEIAGHTISSFEKRAAEKGWIKETEDTPPLQYGNFAWPEAFYVGLLAAPYEEGKAPEEPTDSPWYSRQKMLENIPFVWRPRETITLYGYFIVDAESGGNVWATGQLQRDAWPVPSIKLNAEDQLHLSGVRLVA